MKRLTTNDVASQLHVKPEVIREWAAGGSLRGCKVGHRWLFEQADVDAYVENHENRAPDRRRRRRAA